MQNLGIVLSLTLAAFGVVIVAAGDAMWRWQEWSNRARGIPHSERTKAWDDRRRLSGLFVVAIGASSAYVFLNIP